ncbi:hypothetical protein ABPG74_011958 [Tetrahymena malaccensis]
MRANKQNQKKGYQEFDSNDEDQNLSNNSNFDDSSSDKNSANMGSAPEDSNDDDENNNYGKSSQARQNQAKGQENARGIQNRQGQAANAKAIQMADLRQNQNYGNERQKQQQLQKNKYNNSDEEEEIPSQNYNPKRTTNQSLNTRSLNQMKDQKSQLVNQRDQKNQQQQDSSDEEEEDDVEYNPNKQKKDDKRLIAAQQGQNQFGRNQNQIQTQKKVPPKPTISKIAQNIKGQQKHVKLVEEDEDIQQQNFQDQDEDEEEEIDEVNYQQKTNRLKEEKEIRQRLSDERKRELEKNKKKKKSTKLDADENEENDDDDDEDDDDEYDYDYDDFNDENRKKREEYDFSNTITYWIGFVIIAVFMSILYYFMIQRGFTTSYRDQQYNKVAQNRPVLLYPQSSYPLDVYFLNDHWQSIKHFQDRRDEATCQADIAEDSFFDFSIQVSSEKTRFFNSYVNLECQNQCSILQIQEELYNNGVKQKEQTAPRISFEDLVKEYKCDGERESFFNGKCQECNELCLQCSQFTHTCYSCYDQEYLTNKKCQTSCDGQQTAINHFCIQPKPKMNLQILKGMQHNIYILHTPESPQSFKDQLQKQQMALEEAKKSAQTNSTTQNKPEETEQNKKEEFKLKKYPFVFLLNDYRYTQDDIFLTKQVEKYFDQFFLLSIPYFKEMLTASELDNLIDEIIDNVLDYDMKQFVDFYSIMGYGLTGQLAIQIGLEQKEFYYKKRVSIVTAVSDNSFAAIINHDSNSFESYIQQKETYFKDNLFCYLSQKKKQIKSTQVEFKKDIEADNQESKLHDHLDFYLKHSFDEILFHSKNKKLSQKF